MGEPDPRHPEHRAQKTVLKIPRQCGNRAHAQMLRLQASPTLSRRRQRRTRTKNAIGISERQHAEFSQAQCATFAQKQRMTEG